MKYGHVNFLQVKYHGDWSLRSNKIFTVCKDTLCAIVHQDKGELIPAEYSHIEPYWMDERCADSDANFIVYGKGDSCGVINSEGKKIIPMDKQRIGIHHFAFDSCGARTAQIACVEKNGELQAWNLQTGKSSAKYRQMFPFQQGMIFSDPKGWGILDADFREIFHSKKGKPGASVIMQKPELNEYTGTWSSSDNAQETFRVLFEDSIVFVYEHNPEAEAFYGYDHYRIGVVNFYSHKTIAPRYERILLYRYQGHKYLWAVENVLDKEETPKRIDIYDESLHIRYSVPYEQIQTESLLYYKEFRPLYVILRKGKYGAVNPAGKEVVPFKYTTWYGMNAQWKGYHRHKDYHVFGDGRSRGLFDENGAQLLPVIYDSIYVSHNDSTLLVVKDELTDIYSYDLKLIAEKCAYVIAGIEIDRHSHNKVVYDIRSNRDIYTMVTYFVRNGELFIHEHGKIVKADSARFFFEDDKMWIYDRFYVDKTGRVFENRYVGPMAKTRDAVPVQGRLSPAFWWEQEFTGTASSVWYLYDSVRKNKIYDFAFDYPLLQQFKGQKIFRSAGRYGVLNDNYSIMLAAEYDYIYSDEVGFFLVRQNGKWRIYDQKTAKFSPAFDEISFFYRYRNKGWFVLDGDRIGSMDRSFRMVLPLMPVSKAIETQDLAALIGFRSTDPRKIPHTEDGVIYNAPNAEMARKINNRHLVEKLIESSTASQFLDFDRKPDNPPHTKNGLPGMESHFNEYKKTVEFDFTLLPKNFYSELVITDSVSWKKHLSTRKQPNAWQKVDPVYVFRNYKIANNELVPFTELSEILKMDPASVATLDSLILSALEREKLSARIPADKDKFLAELKTRFTISANTICFYLPGKPLLMVEVSYHRLRDLFLKPELFMSR